MTNTYTAFVSGRKVAHGALEAVALTLAGAGAPPAEAKVIEDATGKAVELDLSGGEVGVRGRYGPQPRHRGRPKLGVVAREVTLLPHHWDWLNAQPGGASVSIRRLAEAAINADTGVARRRDAAFAAIGHLAADQPQVEAAREALLSSDEAAFRGAMAGWPDDIARYILALLRGINPGNTLHGGGETL